jgi:hypothetical protein
MAGVGWHHMYVYHPLVLPHTNLVDSAAEAIDGLIDA